jgi:hypothetical protein
MLVDKDLGINDLFIYIGGDRHCAGGPELKRCSPKLIYVFQTLVKTYWHNFRGRCYYR